MKKYLFNLIWMLADRFLMLVFQLYIFVSIKRLYDLEILGGWSTINNLSQLLMSLFMLGIDVVVVKRIVETKERAGVEIGSAITIQFFGAIAYSIFFWLIIRAFYQDIAHVNTYFIVFVVANFFSIFSKTIFWHYSALVESKFRAITIMLSMVFGFGFTFLANLQWPELIFFSFAFYYFVQFLVAVAIYFFYFDRRVLWRYDKTITKSYLVVGSKLIISTLSVAIFVQVDSLMLEKFSGVEEVGVFNAALKISTIWFFMAGVIASAFFPKIIHLKSRKSDCLFLLQWMITLVIYLTLFASIFITIFGGYILQVLYGEPMVASAKVLSIHIWSSLFVFMGAFSSKWLYANDEINLDIYKTVVAAVFNVALNLLVIPAYGAVGASVVSLASYFIANFLFFLFIKRVRSIFVLQCQALLAVFNPLGVFRDYRKIKCLFQS